MKTAHTDNFWDGEATPAGVFNVGDDYDPMSGRQAEFIVNSLDVYEGIVLDLGCGIGRLMRRVTMRRPSLSLIGVDSSMEMVLAARAATAMVVICGNGERLPVLPPLDGVYCVLMFQHVDDRTVAAYLTDLAELLRPGARLVAQWVVTGDEAPLAYPRSTERIVELHETAGLVVTGSCDDSGVTGYADGWLWTVADNGL